MDFSSSRRRIGKRASLELSTNAIVILIIGIVILGLALGFVNSIFSNLSTTFTDLAGKEPSPTPATSSTPLTISNAEKSVTSGKPAVLKFSIYNGETGEWTATYPAITCSAPLNTVFNGNTGTSYDVLKKTVPIGQSVEYTINIKMPSVAKGNYLCGASIKGTGVSTTTQALQQEIIFKVN